MIRDFAPLLALNLRSNSAFELVVFDRLASEEQARFKELRKDPNFYGVLRRRTSGAAAKAVDRETALLFLTLREAGRVPAYVADELQPDRGRSIARLVADGILEVELGGRFSSGTEALNGIAPYLQSGAGTRLHRISQEALRYAQALPIENPSRLADKIYEYNRLPVTPQWRKRMSGIHWVTEAAFEQEWRALPASSAWNRWESRAAGPLDPERPTYKLYVSPLPESLLNGGLARVVSALTGSGAAAFKIGAGEAGLLRPDKIVAYFRDFDALADASARIAERIADMPSHGVPFTAELAGDGSISWGVDPPRKRNAPWDNALSWRQWISQRLASAILDVRSSGASEPWRFAVERLELDGVDVERWAPRALLFETGR